MVWYPAFCSMASRSASLSFFVLWLASSSSTTAIGVSNLEQMTKSADLRLKRFLSAISGVSRSA